MLLCKFMVSGVNHYLVVKNETSMEKYPGYPTKCHNVFCKTLTFLSKLSPQKSVAILPRLLEKCKGIGIALSIWDVPDCSRRLLSHFPSANVSGGRSQSRLGGSVPLRVFRNLNSPFWKACVWARFLLGVAVFIVFRPLGWIFPVYAALVLARKASRIDCFWFQILFMEQCQFVQVL